MKNQLIVGDRFEGVLLETFIDNRSTRPRVRPLDFFNSDLRVEFPRHLREDNPIGTRFRADVKVAQKTMNNQPYGSIYLVATDHTIEKVEDFKNNRDLTGEFPEGKIVERIHRARERNSQVVILAKENYKKIYGKVFCQICGFDFEKEYGLIGKDFVEAHHTIAVSEMSPEHKTKIEDIAMLCANCHRMIHKKRPWLTMNELKKLLKK